MSKFFDGIQSADDVRDELAAMGCWAQIYLDSLTDPAELLGHLLPNVAYESHSDVEAAVRMTDRLMPGRFAKGVLIDADASGGFNVDCFTARAFVAEWAQAFATFGSDEERNAFANLFVLQKPR